MYLDIVSLTFGCLLLSVKLISVFLHSQNHIHILLSFFMAVEVSIDTLRTYVWFMTVIICQEITVEIGASTGLTRDTYYDAYDERWRQWISKCDENEKRKFEKKTICSPSACTRLIWCERRGKNARTHKTNEHAARILFPNRGSTVKLQSPGD